MERLIRVVLVMSLFMFVIPMGLAETAANSTGSTVSDVTKMTPTFKTIPAVNTSFTAINPLNVSIVPKAANVTFPAIGQAAVAPATTAKTNATPEAKATVTPVATVKANTTEAKETVAPVATVKANTTETKANTTPVEAKVTITPAPTKAVNATENQAANTTAVSNVTASLNSTANKQ